MCDLKGKLLAGTAQSTYLFGVHVNCVSEGPDADLQQTTLEGADHSINLLDVPITRKNTHNHLIPSFAIVGKITHTGHTIHNSSLHPHFHELAASGLSRHGSPHQRLLLAYKIIGGDNTEGRVIRSEC